MEKHPSQGILSVDLLTVKISLGEYDNHVEWFIGRERPFKTDLRKSNLIISPFGREKGKWMRTGNPPAFFLW
jgi:hypothetical protein